MSEWFETELKNLTVKIGSGATPRGGQEAYKSEGISLIRSQNILDFSFSNNGLAFIDDEQARQLQNVELKEKDVLINITGDSVARVCMVPDEILPARVNQHVAILRTDTKKLDPDYLLYYLLNPVVKRHLLRISSDGATRNALTKSNLEELVITAPKDVRDQKDIASKLKLIDSKISLLRQQNQTLEELAHTLFKRWFVDFEFPDENGQPYKSTGGKMIDSELGVIPVGWMFSTIGDNIETIGGGTPSTTEPTFWDNGEIFWYSPTDLTKEKSMYSIGSAKKITELGLQKSSAKQFSAYSLLMTSRATVGELTINIQPATTNQGFITLIPNENLSIHFLYVWLKSNLKKVHNLASGSTFPEISKTDFRNIEVIIATKKVHTEFDNIMNPIFKSIEKNTKEIQSLTELRDTLLPKLMSGELTINEL